MQIKIIYPEVDPGTSPWNRWMRSPEEASSGRRPWVRSTGGETPKFKKYNFDEDNHIIAVIKPAGILTQGDRSGQRCLMEIVKDCLKTKYRKPGNVFLGLVHRLDKPVAGVVLFGKTSKGAARLSEQFRNRRVKKTYHAIVLGRPHESCGTIKEKINKISFFAESFAGNPDGELLEKIKRAIKTRTAELSWMRIKSNGKYSLLEISPKTGRFHQIRAQMANMGYPILGDKKYAGSAAARQMEWGDRQSIALAETRIEFKTATGGKLISLVMPFPDSWKKYTGG